MFHTLLDSLSNQDVYSTDQIRLWHSWNRLWSELGGWVWGHWQHVVQRVLPSARHCAGCHHDVSTEIYYVYYESYILILYVCIIREHKKMSSLQQCTCYFYTVYCFVKYFTNLSWILVYWISFVCNNVNKQVWWIPKGVDKSANFFNKFTCILKLKIRQTQRFCNNLIYCGQETCF